MNKKEAWKFLNSIGIYTLEQLRQAVKELYIPIGMFTEGNFKED